MTDIDLSGEGREAYSPRTEDRAQMVLDMGLITRISGVRAAWVRSLRGGNTYVTTAVSSVTGEVLGMTCSCPNGRKGNYRARCYHAAAFEKVLVEGLEIPEEKIRWETWARG